MKLEKTSILFGVGLEPFCARAFIFSLVIKFWVFKPSTATSNDFLSLKKPAHFLTFVFSCFPLSAVLLATSSALISFLIRRAFVKGIEALFPKLSTLSLKNYFCSFARKALSQES